MTRPWKSESVQKHYPQNDPLVKEIDAIIASGVFKLPSESRKAERAVKDLAQVEMVYRTAPFEGTFIRDYRWGERFEPSFREAERLFLEIVKMAGSAKP